MWLPTWTLLAGVGGQLDGHVLLGLLVGHGDEEGLGGLIFEQGGHIQVLEALAAGDGQAVPLAVDGVAGQGGRHALDEVGGVDAEALGTFVNEGEAEVLPPRLAGLVLLFGDAGEAGHLLLGKAHDLPHGADALGHLGELGFQVGLFHDERFPFLAKSNQNQNKKSVSKEKLSFETDCMIRGTTQIAHTRPSSGSNKP